MRLQQPCLIALALTAILSGSAHAESDDLATAVLGLETQDVQPKVADEIAELLRQNVSSSHDMRLGAGRDLVELKLVFSCADEGHACMAQAARSLNVERLIYGSIKRSGDAYVVWLKLFDVKHEKIEAWLSETVPREKLTGSSLKPIVTRWFYKLRGRSADVGTLRISAEVPGAVVSLDGVAAGATSPDKPLVLSQVPAGKHEVSLTKVGFGAGAQFVSLAAGQVLDLKLELREPNGAPAVAKSRPVVQLGEADRDESEGARGGKSARGAGYRTGFWVTLAGGVVSAGAALKFGLDVRHVNQDLDAYRRFPCATGVCDTKGQQAVPLTSAERDAASSLTDKGNRDHALQWVCIGVGSALGIASGYFLYKGYLAGGDEHSGGESAMVQRGLRIFPAASASSGSVLAEFDF
jgi:hypothetical protein